MRQGLSEREFHGITQRYPVGARNNLRDIWMKGSYIIAKAMS